MSKLVIIAVIFLLIISCNNKNQIDITAELKIIDTLPISNSFITKDWQERELYEINYIGEKKDTIFINHYPTPPPPPGFSYDTLNFYLSTKDTDIFNNQIEKYIFEINERSNISSIYYDPIKISIDTTQFIGKDSYPAYPVVIENKNSDSLRVGYAYDRRIYAILEAKDSIGDWKTINSENFFHGLPINKEIVLLKDHIIITSVYSYFGNYNTELRLKIGNSYSNVFTGWINYNQFNSKFNEKGEYKDEYIKN